MLQNTEIFHALTGLIDIALSTIGKGLWVTEVCFYEKVLVEYLM